MAEIQSFQQLLQPVEEAVSTAALGKTAVQVAGEAILMAAVLAIRRQPLLHRAIMAALHMLVVPDTQEAEEAVQELLEKPVQMICTVEMAETEPQAP
jgi:hypothetical protein